MTKHIDLEVVDRGVRDLALFTSGARSLVLPDEVKTRAHALILDSLACSAASVANEEQHAVASTLLYIGGAPSRAPQAKRKPLEAIASPVAAAGAFAYSVTASTFCDILPAANLHVSPAVLGGLVGVLVNHEIAGERLLVATAVGMEVAARLSAAIDQSAFRTRGWHSPGVIGPWAAVAAGGAALGADARTLASAFAIASAQAAGTYADWRTPAMKLHQANGAISGVLALQLAIAGLEAHSHPLTNPDGGLFSVFSTHDQTELLGDGLGEHWMLEEIRLRQWPAAAVAQSLIGTLIGHIRAARDRLDKVATVTVQLPTEIIAQYSLDSLPVSQFHSQMSLRHLLSIVLVEGSLDLRHLRQRDENVPQYYAAAERIHLVENRDLTQQSALLIITHENGPVIAHPLVLGTERQTSDEMFEIAEGKFSALVGAVLPPEELISSFSDLLALEGSFQLPPIFEFLLRQSLEASRD